MSTKITQLIKGVFCNAKCPFCLSLRNRDGKPPVKELAYTAFPEDALVKLYDEALALGSRELVVTSYGDPLAPRNNPASLPMEIALARDCGYKAITLLTNGNGLSPMLLHELHDSGLTHLSLSVHTLDAKERETLMGESKGLLTILANGAYAARLGIIVRHNYLWRQQLSLEKVIEQANRFKASQITLIESVPVNAYAESVHAPLPEMPSDAELVVSHAWGMDIYAHTNQSIALCKFGQEDSDFSEQEKNLYINLRSDGTVVLRDGGYFDVDDGIIHRIK